MNINFRNSCLLIIFSVLSTFSAFSQNNEKQISLAGVWRFSYDSADLGIQQGFYNKEFSDHIHLPGSMLENGKGYPVTLQTDWTASIYDSSWYFNPAMAKYRDPKDLKFPFFLTPLTRYVAPAWYQKTVIIPQNWKGTHISLFLERAHFETMVWVDSKQVGMENSLSTPHIYDLSAYLKPGKHILTIRVDNRIKEINPGKDSHSVSDQTQGNYNGIVGEIALRSEPLIHIRNIQTIPDLQNKLVRIKLFIENQSMDNVGRNDHNAEIRLSAKSFNTEKLQILNTVTKKFLIGTKDTSLEISYPMGNDFQAWDEFHPALYNLSVDLKTSFGSSDKNISFGMREIKAKGTRFTVNGREVFMRGTVENADFPKTGYVPMDLQSWVRVFKICKSYGLNLMRFHSYCPPEAAFKAADLVGIYLHVEGPSWANHGSSLGDGKPIDKYIYDETNRIDSCYGNYPSFCLLGYGNEPRGGHQVAYLNKFVDYWKAQDQRHLYTGASTGMSWPWVNEEQFTVRSGPRNLPWLNASPNTLFDHSKAISGHDKPYLAHEVGQYCAFPDFREIKEYTGGHKAKNFELFRQDLKDHGMADMAADFLKSSGELQLLCYKGEIEAALRTPGFAGFELLSLNDYSGQGTALVGVLNVFWESKGYVDPKTFSRFCGPVVPLARIDKFVYKNNENFQTDLEVANFSAGAIKGAKVSWSLKDKKGVLVAQGDLGVQNIAIGNNIHLGHVNFGLNKIALAKELNFSVSIKTATNILYENDWNIWVYPTKIAEKVQLVKGSLNPDGIYYTDTLDNKAIDILAKGGKVFLSCSGKVQRGSDVVMHFLPVFWNTSWFKMRPPHTTGIYLNPNHPAFKYFPTEDYSDMQWWSLVNKQQVMMLDEFPKALHPIVQPIDTWFLNRRLGLILEAAVGKGKLLICSADIDSNLDKRPEAGQLKYSLIKYMASTDFHPGVQVSLKTIQNLFVKQNIGAYNTYSSDMPDELKVKNKSSK